MLTIVIKQKKYNTDMISVNKPN